jgi:hypothetical protein
MFFDAVRDSRCSNREMFADEDLPLKAVENLEQADALLFGRVTSR